MALTLTDICDRLKQLDEITLMEVLEIDSEDLIERFMDRVEDNADMLEGELDE